MTGRVRFFKRERSWGLIEGEDGGAYYFRIMDVFAFEVLLRGVDVTFTPTQGPRGLRAVAVARLQPAPTAAERSER